LKRRAFLAILLLGTASLVTGCMSPEQLAATAKRIKARKEELDSQNPEVKVVYAKRNISKGNIFSDDDIEERVVHVLEAHMPEDATHSKNVVLMKKAKNDVPAGQAICFHDLAPLVAP
jgi:sialic acid synthase SpsE